MDIYSGNTDPAALAGPSSPRPEDIYVDPSQPMALAGPFSPRPEDIYVNPLQPTALAGPSSPRPEEIYVNPLQPSTPTAEYKSFNSDGGPLRASPTHFDGSRRGPGSRPNPLHIIPPLASARSGEMTEGPYFRPLPRKLDTDRNNIDWIVPLSGSNTNGQREKTFGERLRPTLKQAEEARTRYARKAKFTGYALNVAIGMQVLLGSLTTALSAAAPGRQTSIAVSVLGGLSTLVASYLARARGSNEPELSTIRVKDLDQFIRECEAFNLDFGHLDGHEYDAQVDGFRSRFEELLGNANGERRLASN